MKHGVICVGHLAFPIHFRADEQNGSPEEDTDLEDFDEIEDVTLVAYLDKETAPKSTMEFVKRFESVTMGGKDDVNRAEVQESNERGD